MNEAAEHHHFSHALLPEGWARDVRVAIGADGTFASVAPGIAAAGGDARHAVAVPGLPNVHSHAFQRGMAGLAERRGSENGNFWGWREVMYRFAARLGPDELEATAALAFLEMLETGWTRVGEFNYLHHDRDGAPYADPAQMSVAIASAAARTGIALTLLPVFYAHGGFGSCPPEPAQRRFTNDTDGFARIVEGSRRAVATLPDAVVGIAPHSLRAVNPAELDSLVATHRDGPVHIHVAEQAREVAECLAWSGARPVEWLLDNAPVDARWCLIHATHTETAELRGIAERGAVVGLCPITEANLGDGLFPAQGFAAAGGTFAIGSDSNVLIDPAEELRLLEYGQRLSAQARNVMSTARCPGAGEALFRAAAAGGCRALGHESAIAPGASADFVILDAAHPTFAGAADAWLDRWIFAAGRPAVDEVWRRGERLVAGGRHRDREAIVGRWKRAAAEMLA